MRGAIVRFAPVLALLVCSAASAANWQIVGDTRYPQLYVDVSSIEQQGGLTKGWFLLNQDKEKTQPQYPYAAYRSSKALVYANCSNGQIGTAQVLWYSQANGLGDLTDSGTVPLSQFKFHAPAPNTIGSMELARLCGG